MGDYKFLSVSIKPHKVSFDTPDDSCEECVREASVTLSRVTDQGKTVHLAYLDVLIVRGSCTGEVNVYDRADEHGSEAEEVAAHVFNRDSDDFFDRFDVIPVYANILLIADLGFYKKGGWKPTAEEIRRFVRRASEQFDVDLVLIRQADEKLACHFRGYFRSDGPFLIYSKAHKWPLESEPVVPELVLTSMVVGEA